eukprot:ANDGO_03775.mRNA.1 Proteasome subunit beta type-4
MMNSQLAREIANMEIGSRGQTCSVHLYGEEQKRTTEPIVTGTSVLGLKYRDGILIACDTLASYGSMAKFRSVQRVVQSGPDSVVGASGEYSDFQHIQELLDNLAMDDLYAQDNKTYGPKEIYSYLSRVMYNRRSKMNPLWNALVVGGFRGGKPFLGQIDLVGTHFEDESIATGYGAYLARPLMREALKRKPSSELSEEEARKVLEDCLRVLFYRECRTINKFQMARVNAHGVTISQPFAVSTQWEFQSFQ